MGYLNFSVDARFFLFKDYEEHFVFTNESCVAKNIFQKVILKFF